MSVALPLQTRPYTADDLLTLSAQGHRYELIEGDLHVMPPPAGEEHGTLTHDLTFEISAFVRAGRLGRCCTAETGFLLSRNPDTVLAPDFAFIRKDRLTGPPERGYATIVPDLVVETRSPHDRPDEVAEKVARWLTAGVVSVWVLDPRSRSLTVHHAATPSLTYSVDDTLTDAESLPGFTLSLRQLFPEG